MHFARMMGIVPLGIGLTVLGFMWLQPFDRFGAPPLFFRVFASFIALGFVMMGGMLVSGRLNDPKRMANMLHELQSQLPKQPEGADPGGVGYQCSNCGAPLGDAADVSPHGDVRCEHCHKWFNIHGRRGS